MDSIQELEDERFAEIMRGFPCLYDYKSKGYHDRVRKANAWGAVSTQVGLTGWCFVLGENSVQIVMLVNNLTIQCIHAKRDGSLYGTNTEESFTEQKKNQDLCGRCYLSWNF